MGFFPAPFPIETGFREIHDAAVGRNSFPFFPDLLMFCSLRVMDRDSAFILTTVHSPLDDDLQGRRLWRFFFYAGGLFSSRDVPLTAP